MGINCVFHTDAVSACDIPTPTTYASAISDPVYGSQWRMAVDDEMDSLLANNNWRTVDRGESGGKNIIGCKWIFKIKPDSKGGVEKFKARLVAQEFSQRPGFDFEKTYAPVARLTTLRTMVAISAAQGWEIHQLDIKTAYLNGDLDEEVYMKEPPGFATGTKNSNVLRLLRSLYGLKQAGRNWNTKLHRYLIGVGFSCSEHDSCLYIWHGDAGSILLVVYVDDILLSGSAVDLL